VRTFGEEGGALGFESDGDVAEEDEAEDDVLVVGGLQVLAEFIGGEEEVGLEAEGGSVIGGLAGSLSHGRFVLRPFWDNKR
jgi:hypothetical protein